MKCVAISDTHGMYLDIDVPDGDILIHAGDITRVGGVNELYDFNYWLGNQPHQHKIVIAGNHDWCFESDPKESKSILTNAIYLQDESIIINGIKFYGSPWQPWFLDWTFNVERGEKIRKKWSLIPNDVDVLITHGPAYGVLDKVISGEYVGCEELKKVIDKINPKFHVCGHIHEGYGEIKKDGVNYINACVCNAEYIPSNSPLTFDI
ncbi:MAG: metallophosphatase domain-containing protein [Colwellia sp.]